MFTRMAVIAVSAALAAGLPHTAAAQQSKEASDSNRANTKQERKTEKTDGGRAAKPEGYNIRRVRNGQGGQAFSN
jgi:hypothetical protein